MVNGGFALPFIGAVIGRFKVCSKGHTAKSTATGIGQCAELEAAAEAKRDEAEQNRRSHMLYDKKRWSKQEVTTEEWRLMLLRAADILEQKGWIRNKFQKSGRYCAVGAINKAAGEKPSNDLFDGAELEAIKRLAKDIAAPWQDIARTEAGIIEGWNDAIARSGAIVIARMRKVANER